jgi:hypothetical protein
MILYDSPLLITTRGVKSGNGTSGGAEKGRIEKGRGQKGGLQPPPANIASVLWNFNPKAYKRKVEKTETALAHD